MGRDHSRDHQRLICRCPLGPVPHRPKNLLVDVSVTGTTGAGTTTFGLIYPADVAWPTAPVISEIRSALS